MNTPVGTRNPISIQRAATKAVRTIYLTPKTHRILAHIEGIVDTGADCMWHVLPKSQDRHVRRRYYQRRKASCVEQVGLDIPYPSGADVAVHIDGVEQGRQFIKVRDVFIVGLGDSFGSGEGNPDKPVALSSTRAADYGLDPQGREFLGFPTRAGKWTIMGDADFRAKAAQWMSRSCHRSLYSYQARVALQLALENSQRAITFVGFACAGSEVIAGLFQLYPRQ